MYMVIVFVLVSDKVHVHGNQSAANTKQVKQMK